MRACVTLPTIALASGLKFAHVQSDLTAGDGEVTGRYSVTRGGVMLLEHCGEPIALVCGNDDRGKAWAGDGFIVTAHRADSGQTTYMHSTTSSTEKRLGIADLGYMDKRVAAKSVLDQARALCIHKQ